MKIAAILLLIGLGSTPVDVKAVPNANEKPSVFFQLVENKTDNTFQANLKLENTTKQPYQDWTLHFNFVRPILKLNGGKLLEDENRNGDFFSVKAADGSSTLQPGQHVSMEILGKWFLKHDTDAPAGFFITFVDESGQKQTRSLSVESRLDDGKRTLAASESVTPRIKNPSQPIIPHPVQYQTLKGSGFTLTRNTKVVFDNKTKGAQEAATFLGSALGTSLNTADKVSAGTSVIRFLPWPQSKGQQPEQYSMEVSRHEIKIQAADPAGFHYAVQTLRQLLPASFYANDPPPWTDVIIPALRITDYPRYAWRGLHLDVARNFHPVADVKRILDLMALHKLNRFHWHLTDDEGWRIAIRAYPELTAVGAFRGYGLPLVPTLGSGPERQGGFYTQDEVKDIVAYATERQITIIPEIDMPG
ncbi:MAG: family 20 glycosylhydrolase, partial [Pseudobdellovibrionaceae bacterium]|nr:family 20 glycosylhydrolase [Pseudobdellovibrionaceae bacterium]